MVKSSAVKPGTVAESEEKFKTVLDAIQAYKEGRMVIIMDDTDRENEGDLTMPAEDVSPDSINFMAVHGRGLICTPMAGEYLDRIGVPMMVANNNAPMRTAFTVSVDAAQGISTGISACDRSYTIQKLADTGSVNSDFVAPGHVFPLRYHEGGVLVRAGQTEGSVDLAKLAGKKPITVICEIMNEDGTMARIDGLEVISRNYNIPILPIASLIEYRLAHETLITPVSRAELPTQFGKFTITAYRNTVNNDEHIALAMGDIQADSETLVRVHSQCLTGDVFASLRCDCGDQARQALKTIGEAGKGVLVYLRQEGRGIGLGNKIDAYRLQDTNEFDTVEANEELGFLPDLREYGIGAQILRDLGVGKFNLLTNNPKKVVGLNGFGLTLNKVVPIATTPRDENIRYLKTKRDKLGHKIDLDSFEKDA